LQAGSHSANRKSPAKTDAARSTEAGIQGALASIGTRLALSGIVVSSHGIRFRGTLVYVLSTCKEEQNVDSSCRRRRLDLLPRRRQFVLGKRSSRENSGRNPAESRWNDACT